MEGAGGFGPVFAPNDASPFQGMVDFSGNLQVKLQVTLPALRSFSKTGNSYGLKL